MYLNNDIWDGGSTVGSYLRNGSFYYISDRTDLDVQLLKGQLYSGLFSTQYHFPQQLYFLS